MRVSLLLKNSLKLFPFCLILFLTVSCSEKYLSSSPLDNPSIDSVQVYGSVIIADSALIQINQELRKAYPGIGAYEPSYHSGITQKDSAVISQLRLQFIVDTSSQSKITIDKNTCTISLSDPDEVIPFFYQNKKQVIDFLEERINLKIFDKLYTSVVSETSLKLNKLFDIHVSIPSFFKEAKKDAEYVWLRYPKEFDDKNITISRFHVPSCDTITASMAERWFEQQMRQINMGVDKKESIKIEKRQALSLQRIKRNDIFVYEYTGFWKNGAQASFGGPFLARFYYIKEKQMMYFLNGFLFKPGKKQKNDIRGFRVIFSTFDKDSL